MNIIKTPSTSLLARLQREVVTQDEYRLKLLKDVELDYVIDIGANIGVFSLYASEVLIIRKSIICIEPQENNFLHLQLNMYGMKNVKIYQCALGDGDDLYLTTNPKNEGMYQCVKESASREIVKSMTLSSILEDNNIGLEDKVLLKCDCEGGEASLMNKEAMEHMKHFVQICLEVHYGDTYFKHCPSNNEYKKWIETFPNHTIFSQNWNSNKNGHIILVRKEQWN